MTCMPSLMAAVQLPLPGSTLPPPFRKGELIRDKSCSSSPLSSPLLPLLPRSIKNTQTGLKEIQNSSLHPQSMLAVWVPTRADIKLLLRTFVALFRETFWVFRCPGWLMLSPCLLRQSKANALSRPFTVNLSSKHSARVNCWEKKGSL